MARVVPAMDRARNRRGMRAGRRHVLQIPFAGPAPAADRRQALFIGRKAAIGAAVAEEAAVIGAPRIVLRAGAAADRHGGTDNSDYDKQRSHGGSSDASALGQDNPGWK